MINQYPAVIKGNHFFGARLIQYTPVKSAAILQPGEHVYLGVAANQGEREARKRPLKHQSYGTPCFHKTMGEMIQLFRQNNTYFAYFN